MKENYVNLIKELELGGKAPDGLLDSLERNMKVKFPKQYREFMSEVNGAEGNIGNTYLVIWPLEEVQPLNEAYEIKESAPGLLLFGSNGGDTGYAFDTRYPNLPIVDVPIIGMSLSMIRLVGNSFFEFLDTLSKR